MIIKNIIINQISFRTLKLNLNIRNSKLNISINQFFKENKINRFDWNFPFPEIQKPNLCIKENAYNFIRFKDLFDEKEIKKKENDKEKFKLLDYIIFKWFKIINNLFTKTKNYFSFQ